MPAKRHRKLAQKPGFTSSLVLTLLVHMAMTLAPKDSTSPGREMGSTYLRTSSAWSSPRCTKWVCMAKRSYFRPFFPSRVPRSK